MTAPDTVSDTEAIDAAEAMVNALRERIDADPRLPKEVRQAAHRELDAAMWRFMTTLAKAAGVLQ